MSNFLPPHLREFIQDCEPFGGVLREFMSYAWEREMGSIVTQEELGHRIGVSKSVVGRWVNNESLPPDTDTIDRIVAALSCTSEQHARLMRAFACNSISQTMRNAGFLRS